MHMYAYPHMHAHMYIHTHMLIQAGHRYRCITFFKKKMEMFLHKVCPPTWKIKPVAHKNGD